MNCRLLTLGNLWAIVTQNFDFVKLQVTVFKSNKLLLARSHTIQPHYTILAHTPSKQNQPTQYVN